MQTKSYNNKQRPFQIGNDVERKKARAAFVEEEMGITVHGTA